MHGICIFAADEDESRQAKRSALLNTPQDLVVLNMPYDSEWCWFGNYDFVDASLRDWSILYRYRCLSSISVTEDDMRAYFDKYGELSFIQMKKKPSGESRGFGFIRYVELEDQVQIVGLSVDAQFCWTLSRISHEWMNELMNEGMRCYNENYIGHNIQVTMKLVCIFTAKWISYPS